MEVVSGIDANQQALQVFPAIQGFKSSLDCVPFMNDVKFMKDHILQVVLSASEFPKTMNMLLTSDQTKPAFYFIGNRTWSCSKSAFVSNFCCCSLTCRSCCASGGGRCFSQHLRWKTSMTCLHLKGSVSNQLRFLGTTRRPQTSSKSIAPRRDSIHPLGVGGAHRITNCGCTLALAWLLGFWLSIEKPITGATLFSCCHVSWVHVFRNFYTCWKPAAVRNMQAHCVHEDVHKELQGRSVDIPYPGCQEPGGVFRNSSGPTAASSSTGCHCRE